MENMIAVLVIVILVGSAAAYLIKAKRSGVKCVGCPAGGNCSSKNKKKKKFFLLIHVKFSIHYFVTSIL